MPTMRIAVLTAVVLLMINATARGATSLSCWGCHSTVTGRIAVQGNDSTTALPNRLDGGTTAALQTFTVPAGQTAHLSIDVLNGSDTYEVVISGLNQGGVEVNASDMLIFTKDPSWADDSSNNPPYFADAAGYTNWGGSAMVYTYNLSVSAATPPDYYSVLLQTFGATASGPWAQSEEVYVDVVAPPASLTWAGTTNHNWTTLATDLNWASSFCWFNNANRATPTAAAFALANTTAITVNGNIDVGSITFSTGGWTLNSGTGVLAYGATGAMNIIATTGKDTINAIIADGSTFCAGGGVTSLAKSGRGTLILGGANTYHGDTTVNAGALLANNSSGSATGSGSVLLYSGTLGGSGTISGAVQDAPGAGPWTVHPSETLSPTSATTLTVGGLATSANTTLDFNLVTPGASGVNDAIHITGANGLTITGGTLAFTNHATGPASLGYYKILQYTGTIQGPGLASVALPAVQDNVAYFLTTARDPGFIEVHRGFLGDANDDGTVNAADFTALAANFGQSGQSWSTGDFNGDGTVDFADFALLSNDFGNTLGASEVESSLDAASTSAPEPASLGLLAWGSFLMFHRRRMH